MKDSSEPQTPSWSGPRPFVGRAAVLEALTREVDSVIAGDGRAVFLLGPAGSGKTACIGLFQELAFRRHRKLEAEYVDCAQSGTKTWAELAELFTRSHRLKRSARVLALEWLDTVPILGPIFTAIRETVQALRTGRVSGSERELPQSSMDTAVQAVRKLLEHGPLDPRLLIMDSLDRGDSEDLAGASALIRRLGGTRTLFLAAVRTSRGRSPRAIHDLVLEAERLGVAQRVELSGLEAGELREAVASATRNPLPEEWLEWLAARTRGVPGDLWSVLGALEQGGQLRKLGRHWTWEGSPPHEGDISVVRSRDYERLDDSDRRLLALAAIEGAVFHSAVLAELAGVSELKVEDRLARLCRAGMLEYRGAPAVGAEVTSEYAFRNAGDAEAFASELSEGDRAALSVRAHGIRRSLGLGGAEAKSRLKGLPG